MRGRGSKKRLSPLGKVGVTVQQGRDLQASAALSPTHPPKQQINLGKSTSTPRLTQRGERDSEGPFCTSGLHSCVVSVAFSAQRLQHYPCPYVYLPPHLEASALLYDTPNRQGLRCICTHPLKPQACICIYIQQQEQEPR